MSIKEKIAYIRDIKDASEIPSGAVPGNVVEFGSEGLRDSGKKLDDYYDKEQADEAISEAVQEHANNTDIHVTAEEKATWNSKQDAINDLSQIRSNAQAGAAAKTGLASHKNDTTVHVTSNEKAEWSGKQDAISDLSDIRENAEKGAEAYNRDEVVIENGDASAISAATETTADTSIHSVDGEINNLPSKGFKMNLAAYVGKVVSGVKIEEVLFKSVGLYISSLDPHIKARLAVFEDGESESVAISDMITISSAIELNAFVFSSPVWLKADRDYEFKVVVDGTNDYVSSMSMQFSTDFVVEGFKEYSGGSYSSLSGCFKGSSVVQCKTKTIIPLAKKSDVPTKTSQLTNDSGFLTNESPELKQKADSTSIDDEFSSENDYAVGETCIYNGALYRCIEAVESGNDWDASHWVATTIKDELKQKNADWNENNPNDPAYIQNKPTIPEAVTVDDTLTQEGAAADAKAVGDALVGINSHYLFAELTKPEPVGSTYTYQLEDRAINYIKIKVAYGENIVLSSPPSYSVGGVDMARDFVVVFSVTTESDLVEEVEVETPGNAVNYAGEAAKVVALVGVNGVYRLTAYRFTEVDRESTRYLVTGASDPAYTAVREIERALDAVLADGGVAVYTPGIYMFNADTGMYYKLAMTGGIGDNPEVNIMIDQEGVQK